MMPEPALSNSTYVAWVGRTIWEYLPQVLWGAFLFNLICLPAFVLFSVGLLFPALVVAVGSIGPGWLALLAYDRAMFEGAIPRTTTFFRAVRTGLSRGARLSFLGGFPVAAFLLTLPALQMEPVAPLVWLGLGADLLGCAVMASLLLYAFPLVTVQDSSVRAALHDGLILASRYPANTLGLLGMGILFGFAVVYLSLGLLLILPAIFALFVLANCQLVLSMEHS